MIGSVPALWQFPGLFLMFLPITRHKLDFLIPGHTLVPTFPSFRPMGIVGELAYQVLLTIRGPFILKSMSVGLDILIRHFLTDL